jgi:RNA polymerase sigma factor (sigma-70 family)
LREYMSAMSYSSESERRTETDTSSLDAEDMRALAGGDVEALGTLYMRHGAFVERILARFARELPVAERDELLQEVFLGLRASASHYVEKKRFRPWLYGIALQKARNAHRAARSHVAALDRHAGLPIAVATPSSGSPESVVSAREVVERVFELLPDEHREILVLRVVEGFSGEEIAMALGIRTDSVWMRLHRARRQLLTAAEHAGVLPPAQEVGR